jgi:DNA-binding MarR family transcriptional regulator
MREGGPLHARALRPQASEDPWLGLAADGSNLDVHDFPSFRLVEAHALVYRNVTRAYLSGADLGVPEWRVLALLGRRGDLLVREINQRSWMDKGQISRAAAGMAARGLVERSPDPTHKKRQKLRLTPTGRALFDRLWPRAQRAQAALLALLSRDERRALQQALDRLLWAAEQCAKLPARDLGGPAC